MAFVENLMIRRYLVGVDLTYLSEIDHDFESEGMREASPNAEAPQWIALGSRPYAEMNHSERTLDEQFR
jgi:hypothetical protein